MRPFVDRAPLFSVIIPTFNRLELLKEALASLDRQTFRDFEVIVADDGGSDGTPEWLIANRPDVLVLRSARKGPGGARNIAIREARGKYLSFLDSDDIWHPQCLERVAAVLHLHPQAAFVLMSGIRFTTDHSGESINFDSAKKSQVEGFDNILDVVLAEGVFVGTGLWGAVRRDCFERGFFKDDERINMTDLDWLLLVGDIGPAYWIREPILMAYRQHPQQTTADVSFFYKGVEWLLQRERDGHYPRIGQTERRRYLAILISLPVKMSRSLRHLPRSLGVIMEGIQSLGFKAMAPTLPRTLGLAMFGWLRRTS